MHPTLLSAFLKKHDSLFDIDAKYSTKAALMARQALIIAHQPSYERRHNQIESIFLSAIDGYSNQLVFPEHLQQLIVSETAIFDVLPQFFYHENEIVRFSALEVYVQRAYTAYIIECIESLEVGCSKASGWFFSRTTIRKKSTV